jgi:hypothetical protein
LFKYVPYIDEEMTEEEIKVTSNRQYTDQELWNKIADDFEFAAANLPPHRHRRESHQMGRQGLSCKNTALSAYETERMNMKLSV